MTESSVQTVRETVDAILRPLAEAVAPCPTCHGTGTREIDGGSTAPGSYVRPGVSAVYCPPTAPDPRFAALRWPIENDEGGGFRVDASLGAIVRAMGQCGLVVTFLSASGLAQIDAMTHRAGPMRWHGDGDTPEEGLARAFVAAVVRQQAQP